MQKITTYLWFVDQAEQAAEYYTSIFEDGRIVETHRFPGPGDSEVVIVTFELAGQRFIALNGGRQEFGFNESVSLYVDCDGQDEVDYYWSRLTEGGGEEGPCGWLKDRYGLSWQIIPKQLTEALTDPTPGAASNAMQAMLAMRKIDVESLRAAQPQG